MATIIPHHEVAALETILTFVKRKRDLPLAPTHPMSCWLSTDLQPHDDGQIKDLILVDLSLFGRIVDIPFANFQHLQWLE
jgi:hypothetical protein